MKEKIIYTDEAVPHVTIVYEGGKKVRIITSDGKELTHVTDDYKASDFAKAYFQALKDFSISLVTA